MENKTQSKVKILFSIIFLIVMGLFSCELLLRVYYSVTKSRTTLQWQDDQTVGRRLLPSQNGWFVSPTGEYKAFVEINSQGWRDSEHNLNKPENTYRILFIGDSFVENFQVPLDQTFFKVVEKQLQDISPEKKVEVMAMGLGDTGTAQQYLVLKNYGLTYKPDLVVHLFFSGNDVKNNSLALNGDPHRPYFVLENDQLKQTEFTTRTSTLKYQLLSLLKNNSRVLELVLNAKGKLMAKNPSGIPIDYQVYLPEYSDEYTKAWAVTKKLITETKREVESQNGKYALVALANNEQVNQELLTQLNKAYPDMSQANLDLEKPDKVLSEFCTNESLSCYFMLPFFKDFRINNPNTLTHYLRDGHWTPEGTKLAAQFIKSQLESYLTIK